MGLFRFFKGSGSASSTSVKSGRAEHDRERDRVPPSPTTSTSSRFSRVYDAGTAGSGTTPSRPTIAGRGASLPNTTVGSERDARLLGPDSPSAWSARRDTTQAPPAPPPKPGSQLRTRSSLGIGSSSLTSERERVVSSASTSKGPSSVMSKLRQVSGAGPRRETEFKSVAYAETASGKAPVPVNTVDAKRSPSGQLTGGSRASVEAMRDKVEREFENKRKAAPPRDMPSSASSGLLPGGSGGDVGPGYRIPSLHLDEEEGGAGWGILAGVSPERAPGTGQSQSTAARPRVVSSTSNSRMRLDSVEEKEEVRHAAALRQPLRGEARGLPDRPVPVARDSDEGDEDDRPLGLMASHSRANASGRPDSKIEPSRDSPIQGQPTTSPPTSTDDLAQSAPQPNSGTSISALPSAPSLHPPAEEKRKSGFFARRGSKADLQEAKHSMLGSALSLEVPDRSSVFSFDGLQANSEPTSPIVGTRSPGRPGHKRNGSDGIPFGPPSSWARSSSSPPAARPSIVTSSSTGGGFPWRSSSKSRELALSPSALMSEIPSASPTPSLYRNPSISKSTPSLLLGGFMKGKVKPKGKDKDNHKKDGSMPLLDGDDPSFQLRSFRHLSSGAESSPWDIYTTMGADKSTTEVTSPSSLALPLSSASSPLLGSRPEFSASRRGSTYSVGDDSLPRHISAAAFNKQRRPSSSYSFAGNGEIPVARENMDFGTAIPQSLSKAVNEGQEILISPVKVFKEDFHSGRSSSALSNLTAVPHLPRSRSTSAVQALASSSSATLKDALGSSESGKPANKGFIVSSRRSISVSSGVSGLGGFCPAEDKLPNGRPGSALGRYQTASLEKKAAHSPPRGELPPRPASVLAFSSERATMQSSPAPPASDPPTVSRSAASARSGQTGLMDAPREERALSSSGQRLSLAERLAQTALASKGTGVVPLDVRKNQEGGDINKAGRTAIFKQRNSRGAGQSWDLSSSDEDGKMRKAKATAPLLKPRTESMPSGIRRPPPPSIAFSEPMQAIGYVPLKRPAEGASRPPGASTTHPSPPVTATRRSFHRDVSESEEESEESSEDEEPLAIIQQKRSNSSLAQTKGKDISASLSSDARSSYMERASQAESPKVRPSQVAPLPSPDRRNLPPSAFSQRAPVLPLLATEKPPAASFLTTTRSRHSPASSSTGDTSSSGVPVTPLDLNNSGSDVARFASARDSSGDRAKSAEGVDEKSRIRRVSFMDNGARADGHEDERMDKKRNERRRGEAKAAHELGNALNAVDPGGNNGPIPSIPYNPYFSGNVHQTPQQHHYEQQVFQQQQQQQQQQQAMYAMQMAQMNPGHQMNPAYYQMQMHQQAMAYAKYQYQVSLANAAMQAANEEWERASNASGFNPAGMAGALGGQVGPGTFASGGGVSRSLYAASAYGGSSSDLLAGQQYPFSSSASAAGSCYGPPINAYAGRPPAPSRSHSSSVLTEPSCVNRPAAGTPPRRQRMASDRTARG